jgi:hypothetical protein
MQWFIADDPICDGADDGAPGNILGPQCALRSERRDALIITIDSTPAVGDLTQHTRLRAQCDERRIDIACFADRRIDEHVGHGKYLDRIFVQQPAHHVEIVDHHVAE